jgi:hypothetical protein
MNNCDLAYLVGALKGDGYIYSGKSKGLVAVFTQKNRMWLENIQDTIEDNLGNAWIFKQRDISVLETKFKPLLQRFDLGKMSQKEKLEYVAGFFDAEGGIPRKPDKVPSSTPYLYVQFVQKNPETLREIIKILEISGIGCGKLHEYGKKKRCWRFFIKADSRLKFVNTIKSRHPDKIARLRIIRNRLLER